MRWPIDLTDALRLRVARELEAGAWNGAVAGLASRAWASVASRSIARPLVWPASKRLVAIGGATLGGSGKTPLAIACARVLASQGARVALVSHSYRARPREAHVVAPDHDVCDALLHVGDEALVASRALAGVAPVVVAPTRQQAVDFAFTVARAELVVVDGVLQTAPRPASLSLLALDGSAPWGAGEVVPRGDLRAPPGALLAACDWPVVIGYPCAPSSGPPMPGAISATHAFSLPPEIVGKGSGRGACVGLFTRLARPSRLLAQLDRRGIRPRHVVVLADHARPDATALAARLAAIDVDLWLASPKCALVLEAARIPHAVLGHALVPGADLAHKLASLAAAHSAPSDRRLDPAGRAAVI